MADYRDVFRMKWLAGLSALSDQPRAALREWINNGTYAVSSSTRPNQIILENISSREVIECFGSDINRFSVAAHESLCNVRQYQDLPKSTAWPLVMLYYSTLFYSHALLRVLGVSPSFFETSELLKLRNTANVYGVAEASKFKSGLYTLEADVSNNAIIMTYENNSGGSHEHMWKRLGVVLSESKLIISNSLLETKIQKALENEINTIIAAVSGAGANAHQLSAMRNSIQYRQKYGVWFPYKSALTVQTIADRIKIASGLEVKVDSFNCNSKDEIVSFYESCCLLIAVCRGTLADLNERSDKSFIRFGLPRIEKTLQIG